MFIKTVKFTRKKAVLIIVAAAVILAAIVFAAGSGSKIRIGSALKTNLDRVEYLNKLGWEVEEEPLEEKEIIIPREFDAVFESYNELQKQQGFDLTQYQGMSIQVFGYRVINYPVSGEVFAMLYIYNGKVVGGDIHSAAVDGFMHGIK